jgi:DNA mismatch repair protein MutL
MAKIALLPAHIANKIAAGEVIERPASVVKELAENSLDAGATHLTIEIEDGGKKLIRIRDDGSGIAADQLPLAVMAHATSKLQTDADLYDIRTLGFRGEALASIASVSQLEIISCVDGGQEGARLVVNDGQAEPVAPAPAKKGTDISVRNLFFNTPARRKFLRTTNTEMGHISEQFTRMALAHPKVHLTLKHNGRTLHDLRADQSLRERIGILFSPELTDSLIAIGRKDRGVDIHGLIAPPKLTRTGSQWQYVFINGRPIRDRFVGHAIREAYRGLIESSRYPVVFLFIQIPADQVDVNVHPAKAEVRFADSNVIHSQVLAAIRDKLLGSDLRVPLSVPPPQASTSEANSEGDHQQRTRQALVDFFKKKSPAQGGSIPPSVSTSPLPNRLTEESFEPAPVEPKADVLESVAHVPVNRPYIQVHNSYLVAETEDGLIIIDQHALHERFMFEQLKRQSEIGPLESQRFLIPETLSVTDNQWVLIEQSGELLKQLGILLEPFGPRTIAIQAFPILLEKLGPAEFVASLLDTLAERSGQVSQEALTHEVLDMMACKAAVKAGDSLSLDEIQTLLTQRETVERSSNCPHGRPTTIHLSLNQLEKQFKRT